MGKANRAVGKNTWQINPTSGSSNVAVWYQGGESPVHVEAPSKNTSPAQVLVEKPPPCPTHRGSDAM